MNLLANFPSCSRRKDVSPTTSRMSGPPPPSLRNQSINASFLLLLLLLFPTSRKGSCKHEQTSPTQKHRKEGRFHKKCSKFTQSSPCLKVYNMNFCNRALFLRYFEGSGLRKTAPHHLFLFFPGEKDVRRGLEGRK